LPLRAEAALERIARFGPGVTAPVAVLLERLSALEPLLEQLGRKLSDIDDT
jgi:hypothetical protein